MNWGKQGREMYNVKYDSSKVEKERKGDEV